MSSVTPDSSCWVHYEGEALWHERIILGWVEGDQYVVCSPDGDVFVELLEASNDCFDGLLFVGPDGTLPCGLSTQRRYAFIPRPTPPELAGLLGEGQVLAATERTSRGIAAMPAGHGGCRRR